MVILSLNSIDKIKIGQQFENYRYPWDASVNGDYAPHLHFQIISNIEDYQGDYPGVCSKSDLAFI
jgi:hypothetical protein